MELKECSGVLKCFFHQELGFISCGSLLLQKYFLKGLLKIFETPAFNTCMTTDPFFAWKYLHCVTLFN